MCAAYLLVHNGSTVSTVDIAVMLTATVLIQAGAALPFTVACGQAGLLAVAEHAGTGSALGMKWVAGLALFEIAVRRWGAPTAVAAIALAAAYLSRFVDPTVPQDVTAGLFNITVMVGVPVLTGGYIRSVRHASAEADRRRALEIDSVKAAERTAIARELHDVVAHHLASITLRVGVARHVLHDADPRVREVMDDVHANAGRALTDLRQLVSALREPESGGHLFVEPEELPAVIEEVVQRSRRAGLTVEATIAPTVTDLDAMRGLTVLRLVQEGLTNAAKHAGPSATVRVIVGGGDDGTTVEITDRRDGGPPLSTVDGPGLGIAGMHERVALVGGSLDAGPTVDGWRLAAIIPGRS
ncbi:histidine kinase [Herbihabitans rhizosphaerae]|uniref:histidine kinase n=1 Tax=Herbihabitans rhizosphaerae TaxID=1872711 RepID=A0A4Q7L6N6_9PSEU|nr:histidine kinase [Herbihabitans rhizosphaerae]